MMEIRKVSVSDMFSMLLASFRLIGNHPGRFAAASFFSLLIFILLVCVLMAILAATIGLSQASQLALTMQNPSTEFLVYFYAVMILVGLLLMPIFAGWLKLCQNLDTGQHSTASDIFSFYGFNSFYKKLVYYCIISIVAMRCFSYLLKLLCLAFGYDLDELATAQARGDAAAILNLGSGFWVTYFVMLIAGLLMQSMLCLGFTHAVLSDDGVIESVKAGVGGILKNLLSIIAFSIIAFIGIAVVLVVAVLLIGLLVYLLNFIHASIGFILAMALYFGFILLIIPLECLFLYYFWNGVLGNKTERATAEFIDSEVSI